MTSIQTHVNRLTVILLAILTLGFAACDNDDKEGPAPTDLTLQEMVGQYTGTFDFTAEPSDLNPEPQPQLGIPVSFEVTDKGTIHFPEFPADELVKALLGEEGAAGLLPMLGTISYDATIGTPTADDTTLSASLTTPTLRIQVGTILVVLISIEAPEQLTYTQESGIHFTLRTTKCQLGEGETAGEPFDLVNTLVFKARKQ